MEAAARAALSVTAGADGWDAATRRGVLGVLDRVVNAATAARGRGIPAERDAGSWAVKGDRDLAGFVGRTSRQGPAAGLAAVGQAATLEAMPAVAEALVDGPITPKHLAEITRATGRSPLLAEQLVTPEGQDRLLQLAGRLDGSHFGTALRQMSAALDPASRQRDHDAQHAGRFLTIAHGPGGTDIKARLDSVAGHKFAKAIDALDPRPALDDHRSREQRRADALVEMVHRTVTDKTTTPGAIAPVQAILTLTQDTWTALRHGCGYDDASAVDGSTKAGSGAAVAAGDTASGPGAAAGSDVVPGSVTDVVTRLRGVAPVVDETGQAWPASEIARALCDCALTRAVVGAPGVRLDLGREERLFLRRHWLALYASGVTTCAVDGCGMPLRYTELHHIRWWLQHHGRTDLTNCAPECVFHHGEIHRLGLTITRRPDGTYAHHYPDGRPYGGTPPPDGEPPDNAVPLDDSAPPPPHDTAPHRDAAAPDAAAPAHPGPPETLPLDETT